MDRYQSNTLVEGVFRTPTCYTEAPLHVSNSLDTHFKDWFKQNSDRPPRKDWPVEIQELYELSLIHI